MTEPKQVTKFPPPQQGERVTYTGSCHCNAVVYQITHCKLEENEVVTCNCSICTRNGYLFIYAPPEDFEFVTGSDNILTKYKFHKMNSAHYFCPRCGTSIFAVSEAAEFFPGYRGVNVRTLHDVDISKLNLVHLDGKSF
ncbi:hypothetical protein BT63DRAFT_308428 [Microthyrium microscopicum]|uniref:CENP-V/GFA domain-containing protein n=1 Tax=Microthyrium microscopicum TaxID=703497 RepID=A0A6A6U711_9PEZI|nr:hypothetical protein BT63DRAFT_308428 [Microthyrium microscopicum]